MVVGHVTSRYGPDLSCCIRAPDFWCLRALAPAPTTALRRCRPGVVTEGPSVALIVCLVGWLVGWLVGEKFVELRGRGLP